MTDRLRELVAKAREHVAAMSREERAAMWNAQRDSFVRAEVMFGSDADEARYAAAVEAGDADEIRRLDAEAEARVRGMEGRE